MKWLKSLSENLKKQLSAIKPLFWKAAVIIIKCQKNKIL
jgi:hypothetical protein